ncbi:MAG: site-2 protease family protein [Verrucomicrobia bacterium]|nr:site-2 protease family protein [Verrucomicrobiota bacterium]
MSEKALIDGLITYLCFIPILTFHEFAHAWVAWKCGDDTARAQGRCSLNPVVHMDMIGTIVLPLLAISLAASGSGLAGFIIGWGKPVPVNLNNLRHVRRDDTLVALAGPAMNVLLALVLVLVAKLSVLAEVKVLIDPCLLVAKLSLFLCFFNLLPIPPLDGSHVVKNAINMSHETYWKLCQYGFIMVIVAINIPGVSRAVAVATFGAFRFMAGMFGL